MFLCNEKKKFNSTACMKKGQNLKHTKDFFQPHGTPMKEDWKIHLDNLKTNFNGRNLKRNKKRK